MNKKKSEKLSKMQSDRLTDAIETLKKDVEKVSNKIKELEKQKESKQEELKQIKSSSSHGGSDDSCPRGSSGRMC